MRIAGRKLQEGDFLVEDTAGHVRRLMPVADGDYSAIHILAEETGLLVAGPNDLVIIERGAHELCLLDWEARQLMVAQWKDSWGDAPAE
jgi:hypothetical protein